MGRPHKSWMILGTECDAKSKLNVVVLQVKHSLYFLAFETLPILSSAPANSITDRCKPISNRLTVSSDSTDNSRQVKVKSYPLKWLSFLLPTSCMNIPFSSRNGTARAFHQCGS